MSEEFIQTIERISEKLFYFVFRLTGNRDDALDLTQETFIKTFDMSRKGDKDLTDGYFFKTAYNMTLNKKRNALTKKSKEVEIQESILGDTTNKIQEKIEQKEESLQIRSALTQLSERQREVITFRFFSDMKIEEIAMLLSISAGSVKVHLARGLQNMKKNLQNIERI